MHRHWSPRGRRCERSQSPPGLIGGAAGACLSRHLTMESVVTFRSAGSLRRANVLRRAQQTAMLRALQIAEYTFTSEGACQEMLAELSCLPASY